MNCGRFDMTVLIVDHDAVSLAAIANLLMAWQYKVQTANDAHQALTILQGSKCLFDIIISEFNLLGMSGYDFLKLIQYEFHIPVIMMSEEKEESLIFNILKSGAAHFIAKPFCDEDFKNIEKYVMEAKEEKLFFESLFVTKEGEEQKSKNKQSKRKINDKKQEGGFHVSKKSKLVWTPELHNLFMFAIKQIGLETTKVVPKKIQRIMNVPYLTRENVASHLQKYRKFLRDVNEKGITGGMSQRALRSTFALSLPMPLLRTMQEKSRNKFHTPTFEYSQTLSYPIENQDNDFNLFNRFPSHQVDHFPYVQQGPNLRYLDQIRLENSNLEKNSGSNNSIYDQNLIGINSLDNSFYPEKNLLYDGGFSSSSFSSYGGGQGWTTSPTTSSSRILTRDLNFNDMNLTNKSFKGGDEIEIPPQAEITSCVMNESPINSNKSSKKLQGNKGFSNERSCDRFTGDKDSKEGVTTNDKEFDMDIVEALFGIIKD
ncbi:unnamed protein product [Vicia faba]|uniref:Response regulatory domain-containing protein n=1 Tax=Vicia faba TaxID=3906 RepID=A0AAV0Z7I3_VICFA|nr:unnamed protein product [Vicia faba]